MFLGNRKSTAVTFGRNFRILSEPSPEVLVLNDVIRHVLLSVSTYSHETIP